MDRKYKDILIVKCRPKSRDSSVEPPRAKSKPINGTVNGVGANGLINNATDKPNDLINGPHSGIVTTNGLLNRVAKPRVTENGFINYVTKPDRIKRPLHSYGRNSLDRDTSCNGSDSNSLILRKISAPAAITITPGGGFHCDGRVPRDDYMPEYIKLLASSEARTNACVQSIKSVPVSPYFTRRQFGNRSNSATRNQNNLNNSKKIETVHSFSRPTRTSVTVLTESPDFHRNTDQINYSKGYTSSIGQTLSKLSINKINNPKHSNSIIEQASPEHLVNPKHLFSNHNFPEEVTQRHNVSCPTSPTSPNGTSGFCGSRAGLTSSQPKHLSKIGNSNSACGSISGGVEKNSSSSRMAAAQVDNAVMAKNLVMMLQTVKPNVGPLPGYEKEKIPRYMIGVCMDECYPGLYIGDLGAAMNKEYLKRVGITHVLNTAEGSKLCTVNTNAAYYQDVAIQYLGLQLLDVPSANISQYFDQGAQFIDDCLSSGGKVLVHCFMGISRSSTIAASYLMQRRGMTVLQALTTLRQHRSIYPNDGFLHQLLQLDKALRNQRTKL